MRRGERRCVLCSLWIVGIVDVWLGLVEQASIGGEGERQIGRGEEGG